MLVLSRKAGEKIIIGDEIEVEVVEIRGDYQVRLGITAPRNVMVWREELLKQMPGQKAKG